MSIEDLRRAVAEDKGEFVVIEKGAFKFEVREPTTGDKAEYVESLGGTGADTDKMDVRVLARAIMLLVARCVYDPESCERIYSDDDADKLVNGRGLVNQFAEAVHKLMEDAKSKSGKESAPTASTESASSSANSLDSPSPESTSSH